eukprot:SAG22_NODE_2486_length_2522_cov_4.407346_3_plen_185_part_00
MQRTNSIGRHACPCAAQIPLLKSLSDADRQQLAQEATTISFGAGDEIMKEGDAGDCMYVLLEGEVVVTVANAGEVARKHRGDWFGELALMHDAARTATIAAVEPVEALQITRQSFDAHVFGEMEDPQAQMELLLAQVRFCMIVHDGMIVCRAIQYRMPQQPTQLGCQRPACGSLHWLVGAFEPD